MPKGVANGLAEKLARVKLLLCDVDGVLTNATVFMDGEREFKQFNILDGLGMRLLQREGLKVGWISNRRSAATQQRAEELRIDFLYQEEGSKVSAVKAILAKTGFRWEEVCYMGDDVVDLGALKRSGVPVVVANGIPEAKALAIYLTKAQGGHGAVREVVRLILKARNKWNAVVQRYLE